MDYERLGKSVHKLDKGSKQLGRNMAKEAKRQARFEERLAPFKELQARNKVVYDRASAIVRVGAGEAASDEVHSQNTVCVVIGEVPTAPGSHLIAQITQRQGDGEDAIFEFFRARKPAFAREVGNNPGGYFLREGIAIDTEKLRGRDERTYTIENGDTDEIIRSAQKNISGAVLGSRAGSMYQTMRGHIADIELSMNMIDEAARNPELNPILAQALEPSLLETTP